MSYYNSLIHAILYLLFNGRTNYEEVSIFNLNVFHLIDEENKMIIIETKKEKKEKENER